MKVKKRKNAIFFYILCLTIIFFLGMMLIDYGASLRCIQYLYDAYLETLVFQRVEPRIAYHLGVLIVFTTFMTIIALLISKI
ncbi:MAG: hypothetical protein QXP13_06275 [Candidatus Methanomethylicia archaeon]